MKTLRRDIQCHPSAKFEEHYTYSCIYWSVILQLYPHPNPFRV